MAGVSTEPLLEDEKTLLRSDADEEVYQKFLSFSDKMKRKAEDDHEARVAIEMNEKQDTSKYQHYVYQSEKFDGVWVYDADANSRKVLFDGKIQNIHSINLKEDTFEAQFKFYLTWVATEKDIDSFLMSKDQKKWKPSWTPKMEITNAETEISLSGRLKCKLRHGLQYDWEDIWSHKEFNPKHAFWVRAEYQVQGKFIEEYELQAFPFDCQDLTLRLKHKGNYKDHVVFAPFPRQGPYLNFFTHLSELQDFVVRNMMVEFGTTKKNKSKRGDTFPAINVSIKVARRFRSQISKLLLVLIVAGLALGVFAIDPKAAGERLNYLITLILTDIALQQSIRDRLDDFPYETYMDKIILMGFALKIVVLIWTVIASGQRAQQLDSTMSFVGAAILFVFYVFSFLYAYILRKNETGKLMKTVGELEDFYELQDPVTAPVQIILQHVIESMQCESNKQLAMFGLQLPKKKGEEAEYYTVHLSDHAGSL